MKKLLLILAAVLTLNFCAAPALAEDISDASEWARKEIAKANVAGIVDPILLSNFGADITRGEFCSLVSKIYMHTKGLPDEEVKFVFSDTNAYYVALAYTIGVVNGVSETEFAPDEKITREQMAVMMYKLLKAEDLTPSGADLKAFDDSCEASSWAEEGLSAMVGMGIIKGVSDTQLAPKETVSREQAIVTAWRFYNLISGKDVLFYEDTTREILSELGIVSADDLNKGGNITVLEALKTIANAGGFKGTSSILAIWYLGDTLSSMDYLDDEIKMMLMDMNNSIIAYNDIPKLKLDSDITNFEALLYITRLVGNTYGCTDNMTENYPAAKEEIYETAYKKGLIESVDQSSADEPIERDEFYNILHKALFTGYERGGYDGVNPYRLFDEITSRRERPEPTERPTREKIEIPVNAVIADDLSISWTLPEEYSFLEGKDYMSATYLIGADGIEKSAGGYAGDGYDGYEVVGYLAASPDKKQTAIRCGYYKLDEDKEYYFDIDISNIDIVVEGDEINPGTYTRYNKSWGIQEISLAEGEKFEKDCYYILKGTDNKYRDSKYNYSSFEVFKAYASENTLSASILAPRRSFGVSYLNDIRIRKATIKKNADGFTISLTPESTNTFTVAESSQSISR